MFWYTVGDWFISCSYTGMSVCRWGNRSDRHCMLTFSNQLLIMELQTQQRRKFSCSHPTPLQPRLFCIRRSRLKIYGWYDGFWARSQNIVHHELTIY